MATETKKTTLAEKLCLILGELSPVAKGGNNTAQNYKYVKEADVSEAIRALLAKHKVFCLPSTEELTEREYQTKSGNTMNLVQVKVKYTFINADDPKDIYEAIHYGQGSDSGDKALWKSLTGCHKYMAMKTFCLGSEDDPETDHAERSGQSKAVSSAPAKNYQPASGDYLYAVPFNEKDQWKPSLVRNGFRWDGAAKAWRGGCIIPEMPASYLIASPEAEDPQQDELPWGNEAHT